MTLHAEFHAPKLSTSVGNVIIQGGVDVQPLSVTENGTYAESGKAYSPVVVDVEGLVPTGTLNIVQNGQYDITDKAAVDVQVPNTYTASDEGKVVSSGALVGQTSRNITANGTVDTTLNDEVVVAVPNSYTQADEGKVVSGGALVAQTSRTVSDNGTYDTTLNDEVVVNNEDYADALVAFGVEDDLADGIEAMTTYANEVTGESDTTLSDAVRTLVDGYTLPIVYATSNSGSFFTNVISYLLELSIRIIPTQNGSGDPSPSNIRPIIVRTGIDVDVNGDTHGISWSASNVCGGTLDIASGSLVVTHTCVSLGSLNWVASPRANCFYASNVTPAYSDNIELLCSDYKPDGIGTSGNFYGASGTIRYFSGGSTREFYVCDDRFTSLSDFKANAKNIQVAYRLRSSATYQLTPQQIMTIIGTNTVTLENGAEIIEIGYLARASQ